MKHENSDVFSISMIELLLIIMFSLLIVMALLNSSLKAKEKTLNELSDKVHIAEENLRNMSEVLGVDNSINNGPLTLNEAVAQLQQLAENLHISFTSDEAKSVLAKMTIDDVWSSLSKVTEEGYDARKLLKTIDRLKSEVDKLNDAYHKQISSTEEYAKNNKKLRNQLKYLEGKGLVYPPCWSDSESGKIEYTFKLVVNNDYIVIENSFPKYRMNDYLAITKSKDYSKEKMTPKLFRQTMSIFLEHAKEQSPECRYFVLVQDDTSKGAKTEWKTGLKAIESAFYKLEI